MIVMKNNQRIDYDRDHDILYIYTSAPSFGYDEEIDRGIYIRKNDDTDEVIGAVIFGYKGLSIDKLERNIPINIDFVDVREKVFSQP